MPLNRDQQRIVDLGKRLYGDSWQAPMARATSVSQTLLSFIAAGERAVTDAVRAKVIAGLKSEVKNIRLRATEVAAAVAKYERD